MALLSVVIITYNEEKNIRRCLESIRGLADEIVVVDSLSTDNTRTICHEYGVRFIDQPFLGYIEQKNFALDQAANDYVLSLDADESADKKLFASIKDAKEKGFTADSYRMNRCNNYCGQWIKHGMWYPDRKIRLVNRHKARWGGINPHDKLAVQSGSSVAYLKGDILHYTYATIDEHLEQMNRFTTIQAKTMYEQGKKSSWFKLLVNPAVAFIADYLIKRGFLDGKNGLILAKARAFATFIKYSKLLHLQERENPK